MLPGERDVARGARSGPGCSQRIRQRAVEHRSKEAGGPSALKDIRQLPGARFPDGSFIENGWVLRRGAWGHTAAGIR